MLCIVCNIETKKYKCPKCLEYYCSVACFKNHKEVGCSKKETTEEPKIDEGRKSPLEYPFKTEDTVDLDTLKKLEHSKGLRDLLQNPHLKNYLIEINEAPNAWKAMKVAMQEPLFIEFADECMKIVEPEFTS